MPRLEPRPRARPPVAGGGASLRGEQRRIRRALAAVLVAVAPAAAVQACGQQAPSTATSTASTMGGGTGAGVTGKPDAGAGTVSSTSTGGNLGTGGAGTGGAASVTGGTGGGIAMLDPCALTAALYDAGIDVEEGCTYDMPCGLPTGLQVFGCVVYAGGAPIGCTLVPEAGCWEDAYAPGPDGAVQLDCWPCPGGGGRRPRGLVEPRRVRGAGTAVGGYFARMAHDEAASVHAFQRMEEELAAHGAPAGLRRAAARSARDEVRHAGAMTRCAHQHGARVPAPRVRRGKARALEAMARENAVEGCVQETFGALLAAWQAAHAPDAALRRTFARLAADEARHAALSWAVARWAEGRLDDAARRRVAAARARAVRALREPAGPAAFDGAVGRPSPAQRALLVEGMVRELGLEPRESTAIG